MGLLGMLVGLGLLMYLSYRGWSVLLLAPAAALGRIMRKWIASMTPQPVA